jgi:4-hydroxybenzoate polyprenyltransferase
MIREYLEISRFFNMGLTGVAPVLGAVAMWNIAETAPINLVILFIIGCLAHIYGFVINDIVDIKIDKLSVELYARPLVSGHITVKKAKYFAINCMILSFIMSIIFFRETTDFIIPLFVLLIAYILATIYDVASKKYPGMDIFVASAVFLLIIFGAYTVGNPTTLAWIIALIGALQVIFMNMINGAIKDIDHDVAGKATTLAIKLGAKTQGKNISLPLSFKAIGYGVEISRVFCIFVPFIFLSMSYHLWQIFLLIIFIVINFFFIYQLFSVKTFNRKKIRNFIGVIVIFMYATTPIMLSSLYVWFVLLALVPPLWFIVSNIILHSTFLEPKTM